MADYTPLEPTISQSLGTPDVSFSNQALGLFSSTSFLWSLGITACVLVTASVFVRGGIYRIQASESGIRKSNEEFKRGAEGLLGVLALWLIIYTFNQGLLTGDVGLDKLRTSLIPGGSVTGGVPSSSVSAPSTSCDSVSNVLAQIQSPSGICGNTQCGALSGCNYDQYLPIIKQQAQSVGVDYKMIVVTMCKESKANPNSQNKNQDGTYDCGLMQINQQTPCDSSILNPQTNISKGVSIMKQKISGTNQIYPNIPQSAGVFASYNCCSNGTIPNAQSVDCNTSNGFPNPIPKWACPINPGDSSSNMCAVKSYACDLTACLNSL